MPRNSPSRNHTNVTFHCIISKWRYAVSIITAWTPKMIISISNVQMSSGWMPSFTRNLSKTGELSSIVKLFSLWDFRTRSLSWAWRTYFPMTLRKTFANLPRKRLRAWNDSSAANLLVKYVASLEEFPGERSQEESPHLKASFTAAHVLVGCHQGIDNSSGFGRRIVASRLQEPEALVQRYVAETFHSPAYHVLVKTSRYLFVNWFIILSAWRYLDIRTYFVLSVPYFAYPSNELVADHVDLFEKTRSNLIEQLLYLFSHFYPFRTLPE